MKSVINLVLGVITYWLAALCVALLFILFPGGFTRTRLGHLLFHAGEQRFVGYFLDFCLAIHIVLPTSEAWSHIYTFSAAGTPSLQLPQDPSPIRLAMRARLMVSPLGAQFERPVAYGRCDEKHVAGVASLPVSLQKEVKRERKKRAIFSPLTVPATLI